MNTRKIDIEEYLEELKRLRSENYNLKKIADNFLKTASTLKNRKSTLIFALEGNQDGVWDWNIATNDVYFSKRWKEILGYEEDEIPNQFSEWDRRLHPDDRITVYAALKMLLSGELTFYRNEHRLQSKDGTYRWIQVRGKVVSWTADGKPQRVAGTHSDVTSKKETELENQRLVTELKEALAQVKRLSGLLPICSSCKRIRDDKGYWNQIESYIGDRSEAEFSHGICPECLKKLYPECVSIHNRTCDSRQVNKPDNKEAITKFAKEESDPKFKMK